MDKYNIMWTGGLDSTYTMVVYSRHEALLQPYYFINGRKSEKYELSAMKEITELLKADPKTRAEILPLILIESGDVPDDPEVKEAYRELKKKSGIGSQYDWIARYARGKGLKGLIYSPARALSDSTKFRTCVESNGRAIKQVNGIGRTFYTIDMENSSEALKLIFGDFIISETYDLTKVDEERNLRDMGCTAILEKTWFCHTPVLGRPCGYCHPCEQTVESGQTWRFTAAQLKRYEQHKAGVSPLRIRIGSYMDALLGK